MANLTNYVVYSDNGNVDEVATMDKFSTDLAGYISEQECEDNSIGTAVHAVFDRYRGARINTPALVSYSLQELKADYKSFKTLNVRVMNYIRRHTGDRNTAVFGVGKGKNGGVCRWADTPAK